MSFRFLPVALVAVIVATLAVGGVAFAFSFGNSDSEKTDDLLERAAGDLGVEPQALKDALSQAQSEVMAEHRQEILADLVEAEVITQAQADEASAWLDRMPAAVETLMRPELLLKLSTSVISEIAIAGDGDFEIFTVGPLFGDEITERMARILGIDAETLEEALTSAQQGQADDAQKAARDAIIDELVSEGEITQAEGDEIKAWLDDMPDWLMDHGLLFDLFSHGFGGGFESFGFDRLPFHHHFDHDRFGREFGEGLFKMIPELEELRRDGEPFFFAPENAPVIPGFGFGAPGDAVPERRFFFNGPDGNFEFDGEVPPEFEELFERFEGFGFDEDFNFGDLDGLFERLRPLEPFGWPEEPGDGADESDPDAQASA